jgi:2-hydroxy-3-keto-5-methylthiopentenyl-1-phosphate phosphatase
MRKGTMRIEIICDFDGTIARPDTIDELLAALAEPEWRDIEERWRRGEIDSRVCMALQIPLIRGGWPAIERFLDERVELEPSFTPFVSWANARGIALRIASEGIDQVIRHLLTRERVAVASIWASRLDARRDGALALDFSHASGRTHCGAALCKCEIFDDSPGRPLRILVGDGRSDYCAARRADVVFARALLLDYCRSNRIRSIPFESFNAVRAVIEGGLRTAGRPVARVGAGWSPRQTREIAEP